MSKLPPPYLLVRLVVRDREAVCHLDLAAIDRAE